MALAVLSKIMKLGGENGFSEEKLNELGKLIRDGHNREVATYKLLEKMNHPDIPYTKVCLRNIKCSAVFIIISNF